jgi:hypothetical protein
MSPDPSRSQAIKKMSEINQDIRIALPRDAFVCSKICRYHDQGACVSAGENYKTS